MDKVVDLDLERNLIVGQKNVTANEPFFEGHFPQNPIMPGVLILEAMAQTGGILIHEKGFSDNIAFLLTVNHAKFRRPVVPGDVLMLHVEGAHLTRKGGRVKAKGLVEGKLVAEAEIAFVLGGM